MPELQRESLDAILAALATLRARVTVLAETVADIDERLGEIEDTIEEITTVRPMRAGSSESLLGTFYNRAKDKVRALQDAARRWRLQLRTVKGAEERRALLKRMMEYWEHANKSRRGASESQQIKQDPPSGK